MSRDTELAQLARDFDRNPVMQRLNQKIIREVAREMEITVAEVRELIAEPAPSAGKGLNYAG